MAGMHHLLVRGLHSYRGMRDEGYATPKVVTDESSAHHQSQCISPKYSLGGGVASMSASNPYTDQRFSLVFRQAAVTSFVPFLSSLSSLRHLSREWLSFDSLMSLLPQAASSAFIARHPAIGSLLIKLSNENARKLLPFSCF
jgi:hypothetical protein